MSNAQNVSYGKPRVGGAIYTAPMGTTLPTNAIDPLDPEFKSLGYVSEDGLTNEDTIESERIKAWGGDTVLTILTGKEDRFQYTLIESINIDVLKEVYGPDNVTGDLETGLTVKSNSKDLPETIKVIDMILKDGILKRIVIPHSKVSEKGAIKYVDNDATGFDLTLDAFPDQEGNTHYEYIQKAPASPAEAGE